MPPPKQRFEDAPATVRTSDRHLQIMGKAASRLGISRSDLMAILLAEAMGLERPPHKPRISVHDLLEVINNVLADLQAEESGVMAQTA